MNFHSHIEMENFKTNIGSPFAPAPKQNSNNLESIDSYLEDESLHYQDAKDESE